MANPSDPPSPTTRSPRSESPWQPVAAGAALLEDPRPDADRVTFGRLLEHGSAKHMFRPSAEVSYFVRIETLQGERIFWSQALQAALARSQSQPQIGDEVGVRENSIQPVTLIATVHDQRGNIIGKRRFDSPRVHWIVEKRSFFQERMLAAEALRNERLHPREAIQSFPDLQPAYIALDSARRVAGQRIRPASRDRFVKLVRETLAHAIERAEPLPALAPRAPKQASSTRKDAPTTRAEPSTARDR
jgi:hypothetical protein